jgi:hypothetical protein
MLVTHPNPHSITLGSVRECEGMNPHNPEWVLSLGIGVPMDF